MSLFSAIAAVVNQFSLPPSAPVPSVASGRQPRFAGEPVRWVRVTAAVNPVNLFAFARGAVRVFSGAVSGIPQEPDAPWTLVELSPLPAFGSNVFREIPGGLPVQYVIMRQTGVAAPPDNSLAASGDLLANCVGRLVRRLFSGPDRPRCGSMVEADPRRDRYYLG